MYRGLKEPGQLKNRIRTALIIVVLLATVGFFETAWLVTDWFWFQEVKYEAVFWVTLLAKLILGCTTGAIFLVLFGGNLYLAEKIARKNNYSEYMGMQIPSLQLIGERSLVPLIAVVSVFLSVFMGMSAAGQWKECLLFLQGLPFGLPDPLFQKDIGFYIFHLPFIVNVYQWLSFMAILVIIGTGILYFVRGGGSSFPRGPGRSYRPYVPIC